MTGMLSAEHAKWLEERSLDLEVATKYGLFTDRQSPGGRDLAIPYVRDGKAINHKYRGPGKRFRQDPDAPRAFWNEDCLRDKTLEGEPLVITEGELDALAAIQAGFLRTISVPDGAGSNLDFAGELWPLLQDATKIILAGDGDEPGQKLNHDLARRLGAARCAWLTYPEGTKDLNDVLRLGGETAVGDVLRDAKPYPLKGLYKVFDYPPVIDDPVTYETGYSNLNPYLRLWRGEFMVVTGIPSHGKSRFVLDLLCSLALNHHQRSVIASFEMPIVPYVREILREHHANKPAKDLTLEEKKAADVWIQDMFCFIDQDPRKEHEEATIDWIIEKASDAVVRYGVDWLLLDPWNQVEHKRERWQNEADYQGKAIADLKRFARSYRCGVIVVAHPNKDVKQQNGEIRAPTLYDISGSAHWFNAADHGVVIGCVNHASNEREIDVQKSRFRSAGWPGAAWLRLVDGRMVPMPKPTTKSNP